MIQLLVFCLGTLLFLLPLHNPSNAKEISINDLLLPQVPMSDNVKDNQKFAQKSIEETNIDDILGPKDIYPFLPDNHRDSGTGKFNSF